MDGAGALVGALTAFGVLWFLGESEESFRTVFAISLIPGLISMAILIFLVTDTPFQPSKSRFSPKALPMPFYCLVGFQSLFSLVAMNYSFMLLKAEDNGLPLVMIPLAYALYNLTQSLFAIPIGRLADRIGKGTLLSAVYIAFGLGALAMTLGTSWAIWLGFGIYGFFAAGFNALAKAIISDTAPMEFKATAYGIYYTAVGIATFTSLVLGGIIWDSYGSSLLFAIASSSALLLGLLLYVMRHYLLHTE